MKRKYRFCAVILAILLLGTLQVPTLALETGGLVNGNFETVEDGNVKGWTTIKTTWDKLLKTDGASGKGTNYIDLSDSEKTAVFGLSQTVSFEKEQTLLVSFFYKSTVKSAFKLDMDFYDSESPDKNSYYTKEIYPAATNGVWTKYNLIIKPEQKSIETDGETYLAVADSVTLRFRNIAYVLGGNADTNMGLDAVTIRPYQDLLLDGAFDDGGDDWGETLGSGTITYENGYVKLVGGPATYIAQSCTAATSFLPYGFPLTRFRLSFKFKTDKEGTVPTAKLYDVPAAGGETNLKLTKRQTTDCGNGWTEYVYYSATSCATATKIGLMLRGTTEDAAVYFDDVELTPADYWFYDDSIKEIKTLTSGSKLNMSAIVANRRNTAIDAKVVVAFYEVNAGVKTLLSATVTTQTSVAAQSAAECRASIRSIPSVQNGGTLEMRTFVLYGVTPISTVGKLTQ